MAEPLPAPGGEAFARMGGGCRSGDRACGGDARAAVVALLIMNEALEQELDLTHVAVSTGFSLVARLASPQAGRR